MLCRYGGEEFVILMPRMPLDKAVERAESRRCKIADIRVVFGNFKLSFTASAGAALPDHGKMPDERPMPPIRRWRQNSGRNRVVAYCRRSLELSPPQPRHRRRRNPRNCRRCRHLRRHSRCGWRSSQCPSPPWRAAMQSSW